MIKHILNVKKILYGEKEKEETEWDEFIEDETHEASEEVPEERKAESVKATTPLPDEARGFQPPNYEEVDRRMDIIGQIFEDKYNADGIHYDQVPW